MRLERQVALITGSGRNIGKAIAVAFAKEGANLVLNARSNRDEVESVASECRGLGSEVLPILADVSGLEEVNRLVKMGLDHFGKIDVLVSNVAIRPHTPILEITIEEWRRVLAVNLDATFYLCKAVLPSMVQCRSGNIIAIGGASGLKGLSNRPAVAASKGGLQILIKGIAVDFAPYGIRANLVIPGHMNTERRHPEWYPEWPSGRPELTDEAVKGIPLGRLGRPEEIAALCVFLASSDSSYITGQHIMCDGGAIT